MAAHAFILSPGRWIGQGRVTFTVSPDHIHFVTAWEASRVESGIIRVTQTVEMDGAEESLLNQFEFSDITADTFAVSLSNELLGTVMGSGILEPKVLAWEFRGHPTFEGFEVYRLQDNGDYRVHAEYTSPDQYRTTIDGLIWSKPVP